MADTLCGPSNALQQFSKHSTIDRTLQQDRLRHQTFPSEGFRSFPGPSAGHLDSEFEAFQNGLSPAIPPPEVDHFGLTRPFTQLEPSASPLHDSPGWAADFQRLHVSDASKPVPQSQFRAQAPLHRSAAGSWHQDFLQSARSVPSQIVQGQMGRSSNEHGGLYDNGFRTQGPANYHTMNTFSPPVDTMYERQPQQSDEIIDESAFERAFEAARTEMDHETTQSRSALDQMNEQRSDFIIAEGGDAPYGTTSSVDPVQQTGIIARIGSDTVADSKELGGSRDESDELARTAGHLLDNLRDNQTSKFQQSSFLALMRRLRDREVVVDGNDIVEGHNLNEETMTETHTPRIEDESGLIEQDMIGVITTEDAIATERAR